MLLGPGDACVTTFTLPHSASKNELGPAQPRPALSLQPYFTPYVAKYADNGRAKTRDDVDAYFAAYRKRAPLSHLLHVFERESERRVRKFTGNNTPAFQLMKKTYLFLKRA